MSAVLHRTIVVTHWDDARVARAHAAAKELFARHNHNAFPSKIPFDALVGDVTPGTINSFASFCIHPDGSKLDWGHAVVAQDARDEFVAWLEAQRDEEGSAYVDYVCVQFGSDSGVPAGVTASSDSKVS